MFMAAVDQTLLATATPAIAGRSGGCATARRSWSGYLLASRPSCRVREPGRPARARDHLLVALACSPRLLAAVSRNRCRSCRGARAARLGGGGLMVLSQALIGEFVPPRERARFQGTSPPCSPPRASAGRCSRHRGVARELAVALLRQPAARALAGGVCCSSARRGAPSRERAPTWRATCFSHRRRERGLLVHLGRPRSACNRRKLAPSPSRSRALGALVWHERRHVSLSCCGSGCRAHHRCRAWWAVFGLPVCVLVFFLPIYLQLGHRVSAQFAGCCCCPSPGHGKAAVISAQILRRTGRPRWIPDRHELRGGGALSPRRPAFAHGARDRARAFSAASAGCVMPTIQVTVQTSPAASGSAGDGAERPGALDAAQSAPRSSARSCSRSSRGSSAARIAGAGGPTSRRSCGRFISRFSSPMRRRGGRVHREPHAQCGLVGESPTQIGIAQNLAANVHVTFPKGETP